MSQMTDLQNPTEETPKKQLKKLSPKAVFAIRFVLFLLTAFVLPICHILVKYKPFNYTESLSIGFAGLIIIGILALGVKFLIDFYLDGMKTRYSLVKQIVSGCTKIILPMLLVVVIVLTLGKFSAQLLDLCKVLIPCEFVAIIVNPLPKWAFDNNVEGLTNTIEKVLDVIQKKEK